MVRLLVWVICPSGSLWGNQTFKHMRKEARGALAREVVVSSAGV